MSAKRDVYSWCEELSRVDDDVLGTALARVALPPGVLSIAHKRVRDTYDEAKPATYAGDSERWHLFIAVEFEKKDDYAALSLTVPNAQRPVEETHWQFARALHMASYAYAGVWASLVRFAAGAAELRAYHRPKPGLELPPPPPRAAPVTVAPSRHKAEPVEAPAEPPKAAAPATPTAQRSLF